ncbi:DUF4032 domain-containing protein [Acidimicrobiia bacterium EGI L10123]|uniref:DUF4032 domain-containing protein n=1 Tax=Salinilacustrithrix flava TaxID=2957203 RepID=UPI003D7C2C90|nr:DUF4032 domain-containing protein [Acidimicrobiia bacterium EGI L10123]
MSGPVPEMEIRARRGHPDFLDLPWQLPLLEWDVDNTDGRLVRMAHGVSRHVVRFVQYEGRVYALKSTEEAVAHREYDLLRGLAESRLPVVEAVGVVTGRTSPDGEPLGAVLVTRYLDFALPYRYLFGNPTGMDLRPRLVDAGVILLARLHLEGFFWGDCSLNNILFRRDAGALMAYLVDAETGEHHPSISDTMREHDLEIARINIAGDLTDLMASGRIPEIDVVDAVDDVVARYRALWEELTRAEEFPSSERHLIEGRIRRLEDLGFDVSEVSLQPTKGGTAIRMRPVLLEEGHHARELERLTGLRVQENQARRFLADITSWQAYLSQEEGRDVPRGVAAARWLEEVYAPHTVVPPELADRLEPAELFHELLEHRWFLSEQRGAHVSNDEALADYVSSVLGTRPPERIVVEED